MLPKIASSLLLSRNQITTIARRNIGTSYVLMNKADPVQQIFVDKVRDYFKKKSVSKSGLVDSSPESVKALNDEIEKINRQYGVQGKNFEEFPTFKFEEPKLDPVNLQQEK